MKAASIIEHTIQRTEKIHIKSRHAASYPPRKTAKLKTGNATGNNKGGVKEGLACES